MAGRLELVGSRFCGSRVGRFEGVGVADGELKSKGLRRDYVVEHIEEYHWVMMRDTRFLYL